MAQGHRAFSEVLEVILAAGILVVLGLAVDIGGVIGVVLGVGYLAAVLYREFHKEDPDIESGGNSKDMRGKVLFVLGRIVISIVALFVVCIFFFFLWLSQLSF